MDKDIYPYPLTIVLDRYTGVYSGGIFTAWNLDPEDIPKEPFLDDVTCRNFWYDLDNLNPVVGLGDTPNAAIKDLNKKLFEKENN